MKSGWDWLTYGSNLSDTHVCHVPAKAASTPIFAWQVGGFNNLKTHFPLWKDNTFKVSCWSTWLGVWSCSPNPLENQNIKWVPPKSKLQDPNPQNQNSKIKTPRSKIKTPRSKPPKSNSLGFPSRLKTHFPLRKNRNANLKLQLQTFSPLLTSLSHRREI